MSFPEKGPHHTRFAKSPLAYRQYAPDDPVTDSIYDVNMECDASLRFQNRAVLVVNSKDRSIREEPNNYSIKLNKVYKDVVSVELKNANIPNSDYIINSHNNNFYFQDSSSQETDGTFHIVQLPEGNYPIDDAIADSIRSLLEQGLNTVDVTNTYTVTVDPNTQLFTFTQTAGSGVFNILFEAPRCGDGAGNLPMKNHIGEIIGFKAFDHVGDISYTAEYLYNLRPSKYISIRIQGLERLDSNHGSTQDSFCILTMDTRLNNYMLSDNCDHLDNDVYQKDFNPPLAKLDRLNIQILDENGNLYNFRGREHVLVFEIVSLSRHSNYNRVSDRKQ